MPFLVIAYAFFCNRICLFGGFFASINLSVGVALRLLFFRSVGVKGVALRLGV